MPRPGFFPSVLRVLPAPRVGKTQRADYRWKQQPLAHQRHQDDGKRQEQDEITVGKGRPARCRVIESLTKVMAALEASGIEFINEGAVSGGGGRGVRLRNRIG